MNKNEKFSDQNSNIQKKRPKLIKSKILLIIGIICSFFFSGCFGLLLIFAYYYLKDNNMKKKYGNDEYDVW